MTTLLTDPSCGPTATLPCAEGPQRRLYMLSAPRGAALKHAQLLGMLLRDSASPRPGSELMYGGLHCVSRVSWGPGTLLLSGVADSRYYVRELQRVAAALRAAALSLLRVPTPADAAGTQGVPIGRSPVVIHLSRAPSETQGMVQTGQGRFLSDDSGLLEAMLEAGAASATRCCSFTAAPLAEMVKARPPLLAPPASPVPPSPQPTATQTLHPTSGAHSGTPCDALRRPATPCDALRRPVRRPVRRPALMARRKVDRYVSVAADGLGPGS